MLTCEQFWALLKAKGVRNATRAERAAYINHLDECQKCRYRVMAGGMARFAAMTPGQVTNSLNDMGKLVIEDNQDPEFVKATERK